jgi:hypothetical protein
MQLKVRGEHGLLKGTSRLETTHSVKGSAGKN